MSLKLYNTLTRRKEAFAPIDPANVRIYVCGPTVYDYAHIGNARPVIVFDVLYRLLRHVYGAEHVTYVRNITDVDDKINDRAARDYPDLPLNEAIRQVTESTAAQFHADIAALGVLPPTHEPRATEHIEGMKAIIERLVAGGFAYVAEGHVLFSPAAMDAADGVLPRYGALANRTLDEMIAGARVDVAPYKRNATDFVLWKPSKPGEPGWPSPCGIAGLGRPGWHIECSAMSRAFLGETFDIHGGGIDLVFPHHENEIAQSTCAFGHSVMANVWMHNGFLQVEGEKMSKSLGNFVTIHELLSQWQGLPWSGRVMRHAMLATHYREPIDWTRDRLIASRNLLHSWVRYIRLALGNELDDVWAEKPEPDDQIIQALSEDLNTPEALGYLAAEFGSDTASKKNKARRLSHNLRFLGVLDDGLEISMAHGSLLISNEIPSRLVATVTNAAYAYRVAFVNGQDTRKHQIIEQLKQSDVRIDLARDGVLKAEYQGKLFETEQTIQSLIAARLEARRQKNWAESDRIRDELAAMGIQLKDGKDPATGEAVTTWEVKR